MATNTMSTQPQTPPHPAHSIAGDPQSQAAPATPSAAPLDATAQSSPSASAPNSPTVQPSGAGPQPPVNPGGSTSGSSPGAASAVSPGATLNPAQRSSTNQTVSSSVISFITKPRSLFGLDYSSELVDGKSVWVIKLNGWAKIIFAINLVTYGFALGSNIYTWYSSISSDHSLQKLSKKLDTNTKKIDLNTNITETLRSMMKQWLTSNDELSARDDREEQNRWNALLDLFIRCADSTQFENATNACEDLRHHFDSERLPRPDKSLLAKRNLAKLDVIIRKRHLGIRSDTWLTDPDFSGAPWAMLLMRNVMMVCISAIVLYWCFYAVRRWYNKRVKLGHSKVKAATIRGAEGTQIHEKQGDEKQDTNDENAAVRAITSGSDAIVQQNSLNYRARRVAGLNIHALASRGACDDLQRIILKNPHLDINEIDDEHGSLLSAAARSGDEKTVNYVLSRRPNLNAKGGRFNHPMQAAAQSGNANIVRRLLEAQVDTDSIGGYYGTAINAAAEKGDSAMLEAILQKVNDKKSMVNKRGGKFGSPLIAAAARGDHASVEILLANQAHVNQPDDAGTLALHEAARSGHLKMLDVLIERGSALNGASDVLGTPLHAACSRKQELAALRLLAAHADPSVKDKRLRTPLHELASLPHGFEQVIRIILRENPLVVNEQDTDGNTALHLASISGNVDAVALLLEFHARCDIGDKFNAQPLFRAAGCGHPEIVRRLLYDGDADPNAVDNFGRTALHGPAETREKAQLHIYLLDRGANVNAVGDDMKTPLHEACNMGRDYNVELLLECPTVKVNELDNDQFPPLYKALCSSDGNEKYWGKCVHPRIPKMLLQRPDIDVNVSNGIAVQEAARKGDIDLVRSMLLLKRPANIQVGGSKYGGVLQAAAISGNVELLKELLKPEHRADVNLPGGEFGSPLAAACAYGHKAAVQVILEAGADPCVSSASGRYGSPWQSVCQKMERPTRQETRIARTEAAPHIQELLREYGGKEVTKMVRQPYKEWRWNLGTSGWGWHPSGDM